MKKFGRPPGFFEGGLEFILRRVAGSNQKAVDRMHRPPLNGDCLGRGERVLFYGHCFFPGQVKEKSEIALHFPQAE
jgi:hypothetical protein